MEYIIENKEFKYEPNHIAVHRLTTYEESSVLHGQEKKEFIDNFETLDEAVKEYPQATVIDGIYHVSANLSSTPPSWFDEDNAGEHWHDDY